jgi:hypothetical protein
MAGEQLDADMTEIHARVDAGAIDRAAERDATRAADIDETTSKDLVIHECQAQPSLEASWHQGEAERPSATAAPESNASLDIPEIGDQESELEL